MKLTVKVGRGGKKTVSLEVADNATVGDVKKAYEAKAGLSVYRQCLKVESKDAKSGFKTLDDDRKTVASFGVKSGTELTLKDFGPQIGYRTVFVIEYAGPLFIVLFYFLRPSFIYGAKASSQPYDEVALAGVAAWSLHFIKREYETFFIHRFSRPTMPLFNLFKNSIYYWSFGAMIGYPLCHPDYTAPASKIQVYIGFTIFLLSELGNLICHIMLRNLRPAEGAKERPIPTGFLFNLVSCPNYTFEILSWVGFSIATQILLSYAFTVVGFLQMAQWALGKHRGYYRTYGDRYRKLKRKAIVPFVL